MFNNKIISIILVIATIAGCLSSFCLASSASGYTVTLEGTLPFTDVKDSYWFADAAQFCYVNGVINGMDKYTFAPSGSLTRAQFVMMLANLEEADISEYKTDKFYDVSEGHWYYNAVCWAYEQGIISGVTPSMFSPNTYVTREALARMMTLYMKSKGREVEVSDNCLKKFKDRGSVSDWAVDGMKYIVSAGLISGITENKLSPQGKVTRAQAARIFMLYMLTASCTETGHTYTEASCTQSPVCTGCGIKNGLPSGHRVSAEFTCISDYKSECAVCKELVSSTSVPHDYTPANCGKPETCKLCSATRSKPVGEHSWQSATCTAPKTCKVCNNTEGKALGHSWKAANCITPKTCKRCSLTEGDPLSTNGQHTWWAATCTNPKMCKVCYVTEGSAIAHSYTKATCTAAEKCKTCGKVNGSPLGHNIKYGKCTRCGFSDDTVTFNKIASYLKEEGVKFSGERKNTYGFMGYSDPGYNNESYGSSLGYNTTDNVIILCAAYVENINKATDMIEVEIFVSPGSSVCRYTVTASDYGTRNYKVKASGTIDCGSIYKGMSFVPANYNGTASYRSYFNSMASRALTIAMESAAMILKGCNEDLSSLGFTDY